MFSGLHGDPGGDVVQGEWGEAVRGEQRRAALDQPPAAPPQVQHAGERTRTLWHHQCIITTTTSAALYQILKNADEDIRDQYRICCGLKILCGSTSGEYLYFKFLYFVLLLHFHLNKTYKWTFSSQIKRVSHMIVYSQSWTCWVVLTRCVIDSWASDAPCGERFSLIRFCWFPCLFCWWKLMKIICQQRLNKNVSIVTENVRKRRMRRTSNQTRSLRLMLTPVEIAI